MIPTTITFDKDITYNSLEDELQAGVREFEGLPNTPQTSLAIKSTVNKILLKYFETDYVRKNLIVDIRRVGMTGLDITLHERVVLTYTYRLYANGSVVFEDDFEEYDNSQPYYDDYGTYTFTEDELPEDEVTEEFLLTHRTLESQST